MATIMDASPAQEPLVSVVMSAWNSEEYIRESIDSILNQTYTNFELLIVDDGSTDGTSEILSEYPEKDPRVRVLSNESNVGLVKSLNRAVLEAKGQLIARMDADDISAPCRFQTQVDYLVHHPEVAIVGCSPVEVFTSHKSPSGEILSHGADDTQLSAGREINDDASSRQSESSPSGPTLRSHEKGSTEVSTVSSSHHSSRRRSRLIELPADPAMVHWSMYFYCALVHPSVMMCVSSISDLLNDSPGLYSSESGHTEDYNLWFRCIARGLLLANVSLSAQTSEPPQTSSQRHSPSSPSSIRAANETSEPALPLFRLRKHGGNVSSVHKESQRVNSLECVQDALRALPSEGESLGSLSLGAISVLRQPSSAKTPEELKDAYVTLQKLEHAVKLRLTTLCDGAIDVASISADCTARMGECVALLMRLDLMAGIQLRAQWIASREPSDEMKSALFS